MFLSVAIVIAAGKVLLYAPEKWPDWCPEHPVTGNFHGYLNSFGTQRETGSLGFKLVCSDVYQIDLFLNLNR